MKQIKLFNYRRITLRHKATWTGRRFFSVLMALLLLCNMNSRLLAAYSLPSEANIDSSSAPSGSGDKFNAESFLQASNPDDDQHWTLGEEIGTVIIGVIGVAAMTAKACQYYYDSGDRNVNGNGLRAATAPANNPRLISSGSASPEAEEPPLGNSPRRPKRRAQSIDDVAKVKQDLKELDQMRVRREEEDNRSIASYNFLTYLSNWSSSQKNSTDSTDRHLEYKAGQDRAELTCASTLDVIKATFIGPSKKILINILKYIPDEEQAGELPNKQEVAFFVAKNDFSEEELNGYLEALEYGDENEDLLKRIDKEVKSHWDKQKGNVAVASLVLEEEGEYNSSDSTSQSSQGTLRRSSLSSPEAYEIIDLSGESRGECRFTPEQEGAYILTPEQKKALDEMRNLPMYQGRNGGKN